MADVRKLEGCAARELLANAEVQGIEGIFLADSRQDAHVDAPAVGPGDGGSRAGHVGSGTAWPCFASAPAASTGSLSSHVRRIKQAFPATSVSGSASKAHA